MLILFDHGAPRGISRALQGHTVKEARAQGWDTLSNGDLLNAAENAGFDVLLTTDKNLRHQQNLQRRKLAIVVLSTSRWSSVKTKLEQIAAGGWNTLNVLRRSWVPHPFGVWFIMRVRNLTLPSGVRASRYPFGRSRCPSIRAPFR